MKNKWLWLTMVLLMIMGISLFSLARYQLQAERIQGISNPHKALGHVSERWLLLGPDGGIIDSEALMDVVEDHSVSVSLSKVKEADPNQQDYYWYFHDKAYLDVILKSDSLDVETFHAKSEPLHSEEFESLKMPMSYFRITLNSFYRYPRENESLRIQVYSSSELHLNEFKNTLKNQGYFIENQEHFEGNTSKMLLAGYLSRDPLILFVGGLYLITLYSVIYDDRRSLSIMMLHGQSKCQYITSLYRSQLGMLLVSLFTGFLLGFLIFFQLDVSFFIPILLKWLPSMLVVLLISFIVMFCIVHSFTDITRNSYVKGNSHKKSSASFLAIMKTAFTMLLIITLLSSIGQLIFGYQIHQRITRESERVKDFYTLSVSGEFFHLLFERQDEIYDAVSKLDSFFYATQHSQGEDNSLYNELRISPSYPHHYPVYDESGQPIKFFESNKVYAKRSLVDEAERLKSYSGYLCEDPLGCEWMETVILKDDTVIELFDRDPLAQTQRQVSDFIITSPDKSVDLMNSFFLFKNDEDQALETLAPFIPKEAMTFNRLEELWQQELSISKEFALQQELRIVLLILLILILSFLFYQVQFDRLKKVYAIYYVNGRSKFYNFYSLIGMQMIINGVLVLLIQRLSPLANSWKEMAFVLTLLLVVDLLSLLIFRRNFYTKLQLLVKER